MAKAKKQNDGAIIVDHMQVVCDGGSAMLGHPQEFLHINHETNDVVCPYCDKRFVYEE